MQCKSFFVFCVLLFIAFRLFAIELKLGNEVVEESETFSGDYLFAGKFLRFQGEAHDLFLFSETIEFSGTAKLAIIAAAQRIAIAGTVGNGVKAAAQSITLKNNITGTNFLAAEKITFEPESNTQGATFVAARKVEVKGPITGDVYAAAGEVSIQNEIHGNVNVHTGQLKISEQGKIVGDLIYHSDHELRKNEVARVTGTITFKRNEEEGSYDIFSDSDSDGVAWFSLFFKLSFAVLGFLLLLFPITRIFEKPVTPKEILTHSLWGLIPVFVYPTAIVTSFILVITIPLAIALILGFVPLLFVTKVIGITLIGGGIASALKITSNSRFLFFLIGVLLYSILSFIPFFGFFLMVFVSAVGCGLLLMGLFPKQVYIPRQG